MRLNERQSVFSFSADCIAECQFVGHGSGPLERQRQDSHVYRKTGTLPLIFRKNQSRHYIRNCEKGIEFLTCDGCEDEYNK